ncbi:transcriptional regulator [Serratia fonticola]|uniref:transcriptional regulator n=1 Tax=Serratia fonticola TaxID=47917 RepID=UPI003AB0EB52
MDKATQDKILSVCSQSELGRRVGKKSQTVSAWFRNGVANGEVLKVCRALNWLVTPHELRPDLYPNPTDGLPQQQDTCVSP